jgi:hypothetical protein
MHEIEAFPGLATSRRVKSSLDAVSSASRHIDALSRTLNVGAASQLAAMGLLSPRTGRLDAAGILGTASVSNRAFESIVSFERAGLMAQPDRLLADPPRNLSMVDMTFNAHTQMTRAQKAFRNVAKGDSVADQLSNSLISLGINRNHPTENLVSRAVAQINASSHTSKLVSGSAFSNQSLIADWMGQTVGQSFASSGLFAAGVPVADVFGPASQIAKLSEPWRSATRFPEMSVSSLVRDQVRTLALAGDRRAVTLGLADELEMVRVADVAVHVQERLSDASGDEQNMVVTEASARPDAQALLLAFQAEMRSIFAADLERVEQRLDQHDQTLDERLRQSNRSAKHAAVASAVVTLTVTMLLTTKGGFQAAWDNLQFLWSLLDQIGR